MLGGCRDKDAGEGVAMPSRPLVVRTVEVGCVPLPWGLHNKRTWGRDKRIHRGRRVVLMPGARLPEPQHGDKKKCAFLRSAQSILWNGTDLSFRLNDMLHSCRWSGSERQALTQKWYAT